MYIDLSTLDRDRFAGLHVVPDVHAHPQVLDEAARRARAACLFLVQLGDLVDRGPSSAKTVAIMRELVESGAGTFLNGNHEHKLARYAVEGRHASPGRVATFDELRDFGDGLLEWYLAQIDGPRFFARAPRLVLVHAAFDREMLADDPKPNRRLRDRALYGIARQVDGARYPARSREWVDEIPADVTVVVGHDVVSTTEPHVEHGARGGRAICLDTGGWSDGTWSSLSFGWEELGLS